MNFDDYRNISSRIVEVGPRDWLILEMFVLIDAIIAQDRISNSKNVTQFCNEHNFFKLKIIIAFLLYYLNSCSAVQLLNQVLNSDGAPIY